MDKVIPALIVAAISSMTFIAYKHPNAYRNLFIPLCVLLMIIESAALAWNAGSELTYRALRDYIGVDKIKEAYDVAESYQIPLWMFLSGLGIAFYLVLLFCLPMMLDEEKPEKK
jgi:hypothetical protein